MSATDWILAAVLAVSLVIGAWRGLVYELLSLAGWLLAFFVAQWFAPEVAGWLPMGQASEPLRYAAGFVVVFVATAFAAGLLSFLAKKLIEAVGLRPVDRTLGAAFGLVRGVVLLLALAVVVNMTQLQSGAWWQESRGAAVLTTVLRGLKPALPEEFARYLP
ncbi:MAG: CvpA family protein [Burkholderiaceae bacterium]